MSHNINTYIGRTAAWHKLGTVTGKYMTTDELLADPGFQYVVFKSQLHDGLGRLVDAWGTFRWNFEDKAAGNKDGAQFLGTFSQSGDYVHFGFGRRRIVARKKDGQFPDYERVMPKEYDYMPAFQTAEFTRALQRMNTVADERSHTVKFALNGKITLTVERISEVNAKATVPVHYQGAVSPEKDWIVGFNAEYLLGALAHMPETAYLRFSTPYKTLEDGTMEQASGGPSELSTLDWRYIVMPMRT